MTRILCEREMSIEPGHQWLVLSDTPEGHALAALLTGGAPLIKRGKQILVPHNEKVDAQIVALINELSHVRYQSPYLVQMHLVEDELAEELE
ncbi:MAG: hypothetical protein L0287_10080 [Anaerolineae bacterium]|nr:hypothetical protein [Anaerolineae bacterium]